MLAEEFARTGVTLLIVSHPPEQGPEGWLFFQMRGALAEYERAKIDERRAQAQQDITLIDTALAKCDREEQRWAEGYADEVISLEELKGYRADIGARRQSLLAQRTALHGEFKTIGEMESNTGAW